MDEIPLDFRPFSGRVVFPRSPEDLVSTTLCPACQSPLTSTTLCQVCFLDLLNPATAQLSSLATDIAALLDHRLDVIGRIRWEFTQVAAAAEKAEATAAESTAAQPTAAESAATSWIPLPTAAPAAIPNALPASAGDAPAIIEPSVHIPDGPRRSSVQVALLVVGISLLSIAAIFFLVYAFITFGLVARSLIVGGITIASVVTATVLHRRGLPNTAEGISVFALVLIYLDCWALRANDFFGLGSGNGAAYWGWVFVITAVLLVAWSRLSTLRAPSIVAFTVFPVGFGLVVGSSANSADGVFLTFGSVALAGVVHRLAPRPARVERVISFVTTTVALAVAAISALWAFPDATWGAAIAIAVIALVSAMNVAAIDFRTAGSSVSDLAGRAVPGSVFSAIGGALAATTFAVAALRNHDPAFALIGPSVLAAVVALAIEAAIGRSTTSLGRLHLRVASVSAAIVAGIALLFPLAVLVTVTVATVARGMTESWTLGGGSRVVGSLFNSPGTSALVSAVIAVCLVVALTAVSWAIRGVARSRVRILIWATAVGLLLVAPVTQVLWIVLVVWLLLAVLALAALIRVPRAPRSPLLVLAFGAGTLAYCTSWASEDTWAITSVVVICLVLLLRLVFTSTELKATLLGLALCLVIVGAGATAQSLSLSLHPGLLADAINVTRATGFVAILLLGLTALVPSKKLSTIDRRVALWITAGTMVASTLISQFSLHALPGRSTAGLLLPEYVTGFVVSLFLMVALAVWLFAGIVHSFDLERVTVAVLTAPAILFLVDSFAHVLSVAPLPMPVTVVIAVTLAAALSLALATARPHAVNRTAIDLGIVIVAVPGVVAAVAVPGPLTWLVFELAAVSALLMACGRGGLFASVSPRKHVGWLALALATVGLWWWLASEHITAVEPWVLPLSGLLLLIALFTWNSGKRLAQPSYGAAPWITFAALVISIVPIGLEPSIGAEARPVILGALCAIMLLAGATFADPSAPRQAEPFVRAVALAGAIGVALVSAVQTTSLFGRGALDVRLDLWVGSAFLVLVAAGLIVARFNRAPRIAVVAGEVLVFAAFLELVVLESSGMDSSRPGFVRALAVIIILGAAHVVALIGRRAPFTVRIGWISLASAVVVGIVALSNGTFREVEWVSVPLGLALIATGAAQLRRVASSSSWPWLAPGVAVLLIPSLLSTAWDPALWRLVALGVVCVALIVGSVVARLQSPFIIASIVVLIHAIGTFSPQIVAVYQTVEWWVWLALGGIIIVVVSVRFEKSREGIKRVAHSIGGLR
jgi:hypothetical protein